MNQLKGKNSKTQNNMEKEKRQPLSVSLEYPFNFHKFALTVLPVTNTLHKTVINNPLNEASYIAEINFTHMLKLNSIYPQGRFQILVKTLYPIKILPIRFSMFLLPNDSKGSLVPIN
jgi:hypothetical protein